MTNFNIDTSSIISILEILKTNIALETSARKEADEKISNTIANFDLSDYAKKSDIPQKNSELENDLGFITDEELKLAMTDAGKVDDVQVNGTSVVTDKVAKIDLSNYYTKDESYSNTEIDTKLLDKANDKVTYKNVVDDKEVETTDTVSNWITNIVSSINSMGTGFEEVAKSVNTINTKIPAAATSENQLADKDWVNSSIASNTATFRGTFETVDNLPTDNVKDNDYAFIIAADDSGNPEYQRYKYSNGAWTFEYTLNNSSFTSDQWKAINSGITSDTLGTLINATTLSEELAKYLPLTGGTLTGALNVPSISGVGSITLDESGTINTTGTHININATYPRFPNIAVAQTDIARPIMLYSPLDGAMNKSDSMFTYNGNTHILSVSNINTNSKSTAVAINTGTNDNSYFQSRRFRGQGNASEYRHAIDFGYAGHDQVDFYEYGGKYNFWQNQSVTKPTNESNIIASLQRGKLVERGNTLTYPGKSGTIALTSDIPTQVTLVYNESITQTSTELSNSFVRIKYNNSYVPAQINVDSEPMIYSLYVSGTEIYHLMYDSSTTT